MSLYLSIKHTNKLWEKYVMDTAFARLILTQNNLHPDTKRWNWLPLDAVKNLLINNPRRCDNSKTQRESEFHLSLIYFSLFKVQVTNNSI